MICDNNWAYSDVDAEKISANLALDCYSGGAGAGGGCSFVTVEGRLNFWRLDDCAAPRLIDAAPAWGQFIAPPPVICDNNWAYSDVAAEKISANLALDCCSGGAMRWRQLWGDLST